MIKHISRGFLIIGLFLLTLACGSSALPTLQAVQTEPSESPSAPNQIPVLLPTGVPPAGILANTPLPGLPDFEKQITFGFGAGGGHEGCNELVYEPNHIGVLLTDARALHACLSLKGIDPAQPFRIILSQRDQKDGLKLETSNLFLEPENHLVIWQGYQNWDGLKPWEFDSHGTLNIYDFPVWLPGGFPPGAWRFSIIQNGSAFGEFWTDFQVESAKIDPYVSVFTDSAVELIPGSWRADEAQLLSLREGDRLNITGAYFPSNRPIYILLYRVIGFFGNSSRQLSLIHAQVEQSDEQGSIAGQLSATIVPGETYLIVGVSDPTIPIPKTSVSNFPFPFDFFEVSVPSSE
jgi:hypothetical protein